MKKFKGCYTAIVTPFKDEKVDFKSLEKLIDWQLKSKVSGIVPCGSTGEGSGLDDDEYIDILRFSFEKVKGKKQIIAGFGTNSTHKTIKLLKKVNEIKLDALLIIVPYYNKPTQNGMLQHFKIIAENTNHDIILYNIPSRTGVNMLPQTVYELSKIKNIKGIKEASGNLEQISEIISKCSSDFSVLSGDDTLTLPILSIGGDGVISVASNIIPCEIQQMCENFFEGKIKKACEIHHKYFKLIKNLFIETNPIPVKYALKRMGIISYSTPRLPLTEISNENKIKIDEELKKLKII